MTWNLSARAVKLGELPDTVELLWEYFAKRGCTVDCRGPLIISGQSTWGFEVCIYTRSHDIKAGVVGGSCDYPVQVDAGAWIGSRALLAGCHIGEGAIVAAGTVVRGQDVAPHVMVAGNPARVIARWDSARWVYLFADQSGFRRRLE